MSSVLTKPKEVKREKEIKEERNVRLENLEEGGIKTAAAKVENGEGMRNRLKWLNFVKTRRIGKEAAVDRQARMLEVVIKVLFVT